MLQQAFDAWLAHQRLTGKLRHAASELVYGAMWHALVAWCVAQQPPLRLADLHGQTLLAYLASRTGLLDAGRLLSPRYQQRLVSLVQRVQAHQAWLRQQAQARSAQALLAPAASQRRQPALLPSTAPNDADSPHHLLPGHWQPLQALLLRDEDGTARWQQLRDRCAVALQLGAGLGPGDVRALQLTDVVSQPDGTTAPRLLLRVPANGSAPAHNAPLAPWAVSLLLRWLTQRQLQAVGGTWLLPSTRSGKPWGKVAQYESVRRVLAAAGLDPDGGGSFRLRHSFALRQLQHGIPDDLLSHWLGIADPAVVLRYQRVLAAWPKPADTASADTADAVSDWWPT